MFESFELLELLFITIKINYMKKVFFITSLMMTSLIIKANETGNAAAITSTAIEVAPTATELSDTDEDIVYNERRFSAITETGAVFASGKGYFNLYQVVGVRLNPYFFIGQGVGIQVANKNAYQFQTTLDLRAYVLDKKVTPMFTVQAGLNKVGNATYNEVKKLNDTQFTMNVGTGVLVKAKEKASFTLNGGYTLFTDFKNSINGGFIKVGYIF